MICIVALSATAQDVMLLADGQSIECKVLEITANEISYKRADNLTGPTYTIPRAKVFVITYESGQREIINDLSKVSMPETISEEAQDSIMYENNLKAMKAEEARREYIGKNSLRLRLGIGLESGHSSIDSEDIPYTGWTLPTFELMWLHPIRDYENNIGIGLGINNLSGDFGEDYSVSVNGTYLNIPVQVQRVYENGMTWAVIFTPSFMLDASGSILTNKGYVDFDSSNFASMRFSVGIEVGYNYRRWDFGLRTGLCIGNVVKGFDSTITKEFSLSVGYRIKLN